MRPRLIDVNMELIFVNSQLLYPKYYIFIFKNHYYQINKIKLRYSSYPNQYQSRRQHAIIWQSPHGEVKRTRSLSSPRPKYFQSFLRAMIWELKDLWLTACRYDVGLRQSFSSHIMGAKPLCCNWLPNSTYQKEKSELIICLYQEQEHV